MEEVLVGFEVAKLAKYVGFDLEVYSYYTKKMILFNTFNPTYDDGSRIPQGHMVSSMNYNEDDTFSSPTQSLLQKWLREKHNIHIRITDVDGSEGVVFHCMVLNYNSTPMEYKIIPYKDGLDVVGLLLPKIFKTYEEALEVGLEEGLKLITNE